MSSSKQVIDAKLRFADPYRAWLRGDIKLENMCNNADAGCVLIAEIELLQGMVDSRDRRIEVLLRQIPGTADEPRVIDRSSIPHVAEHDCACADCVALERCAWCRGVGSVGVPGLRCTFCDGSGKTRLPPPPDDDRDAKIRSLCDRLDRINRLCHDETALRESFRQIEEWSAGFAPVPGAQSTKEPPRITFPPDMTMAESHGDPRITGDTECDHKWVADPIRPFVRDCAYCGTSRVLNRGESL